MSVVEAQATPAVPALEGEELETALKNQLQFYFSASNLANDKYLREQMDAKGFVSIAKIASFKKVKKLTVDIDYLTRIIRMCPSLVVNETGMMVRAQQKPQRLTLILRRIPSDLPMADVQAFFDFPGCPKPVLIKPEYGDTWFVTFGSEVDVEAAEQGVKIHKSYNGKPVSCHIKSERGFIPQSNYVPAYQWNPNASFYPRNYSQHNYYNNTNRPGGYTHAGGFNPKMQDTRRQGGQPRIGQPRVDTAQPQKGAKIPGSAAKAPGSPTGSGARSPRGDKSRTPRKGKKTESKTQPADPQFGSADFPALSATQKKTVIDKKYDREDMIRIVASLAQKENKRPASVPATGGITRKTPLVESQLANEFPVIYPASPSPVLAAQPHSSSDVIPFLDLDMMSSAPAMDQHTVASAVAQASGITNPAPESQPVKNRSRANSHAQAAPSKPAIKAPPAEEEFKTVQRKQKGGHGHGGERDGRGGRGGRGRDGGRGRGGRGGHGRGEGRGEGRGDRRPPREGVPPRGDRRPRSANQAASEAAAQQPPPGPKKPTLADILKQNAANPAPAPKAAAAKPAAQKQAAKQPQQQRKPQAKAAEKTAEPNKEKAAAASAESTSPTNGKPSFADLLKRKEAEAKTSQSAAAPAAAAAPAEAKPSGAW